MALRRGKALGMLRHAEAEYITQSWAVTATEAHSIHAYGALLESSQTNHAEAYRLEEEDETEVKRVGSLTTLDYGHVATC